MPMSCSSCTDNQDDAIEMGSKFLPNPSNSNATVIGPIGAGVGVDGKGSALKLSIECAGETLSAFLNCRPDRRRLFADWEIQFNSI